MYRGRSRPKSRYRARPRRTKREPQPAVKAQVVAEEGLVDDWEPIDEGVETRPPSLAQEGRAILDLIAEASRADGEPAQPISPASVGVTATGIQPILMRRGTLKHLLRYIKSIAPTASIDVPPSDPEEKEWEESIDSGDDEIGDGLGAEKEFQSQARVTFDPLDRRGIRLRARNGQEVQVARGFEFFPFGRTAYRHSTVGQCLLEALMDVRQSDLYRGSTIDEDVDGSSTLTDHQKMNMKEQGLRKILAVFDEVVFTLLPKLMATIGWSPHRRVHMQASIQTYKTIDDNMMAYLSNARLHEKATSRSPGFSVTSQSLKFAGIAVNVYQHPKSTAALSAPSRVDTALKLRRARKFRRLRLSAPPSTKVWVKPKLTHSELTRALGGE